MSDRPARGPWMTTVLCLVGIVVAGSGLAYALYQSGRIGKPDVTQVAGANGTTVSRPLSGITITPGRELVGSITEIGPGRLVIRSGVAGATTTALRTSDATRVATAHGTGLDDLAVGDVVMVEVSADGGSAVVILAGQISVAGPPVAE